MEEFEDEFSRDAGPTTAHFAHPTGGPWFLQFWSGAGPLSPPDSARRLRSRRRAGPTHRRPRPFSPRPHRWSSTSDSLFDAVTHQMLVGWAVRWMRGAGHGPRKG